MLLLPGEAQSVTTRPSLDADRHVPSRSPFLQDRTEPIDHLIADQLETALPQIELARDKQRNPSIQIGANPVKLVAEFISRYRSICDGLDSIAQSRI
jgi:hypothetical protein